MRTPNEVDFSEKFVAYIDVLGFADRVRAAEVASHKSLGQVVYLLGQLGSVNRRSQFAADGPSICPAAKRLRRDLDFQYIQISDCAVLSTEVSPSGIINLVGECCSSIVRLLHVGAMCRGYITKGKLYHTSTQVIGTGYMEAFSRESQVAVFRREANERGTPFVEVDAKVVDYVESSGDACVRKIFDRMTRRDNGSVALYPFKIFAHQMVLGNSHGSKFDAEHERQSNNNMRQLLQRLAHGVRASVNPENPRAIQKAEHYIAALDEQLKGCDAMDRALDERLLRFPSPRS